MGNGSADERHRSRSVLGDVTNQLGKRRFVSIPGNSVFNSGNDYLKNVENESGNTKFARKISSGEENSSKGNCDSKFVVQDGKIDASSTKVKESSGSQNLGRGTQFSPGKAVSNVSGFPNEIKELSGMFDGNRVFVLGNLLRPRVGEREKSLNSSSSVVGGEHHERRTVSADFTRKTVEASAPDKDVNTHVFGSNVEELGGGDVTLNMSGSTGCSIPSGSSVPKLFESQIRSGYGNDGGSNSSAEMAFLNTCSCSLCLKAAYMWSDLHYQDAKCRLAAIKKSRKEYRSVIERNFSHGESDKSGQENSKKFTNLEFDLLGQWRSLFLHTDNILAREGTQLQSSFLKLKELRENCKADLEILHSAPSNE